VLAFETIENLLALLSSLALPTRLSLAMASSLMTLLLRDSFLLNLTPLRIFVLSSLLGGLLLMMSLSRGDCFLTEPSHAGAFALIPLFFFLLKLSVADFHPRLIFAAVDVNWRKPDSFSDF